MVAVYKNKELGLAALVSEPSFDGYAVVLKDTDAGEYLPTVKLFPNRWDAIAYAKGLVK